MGFKDNVSKAKKYIWAETALKRPFLPLWKE